MEQMFIVTFTVNPRQVEAFGSSELVGQVDGPSGGGAIGVQKETQFQQLLSWVKELETAYENCVR